MKKQYLLLVFLLAFFAGISTGYAQCTSDALHPAAGVEYTYSATISGTGYNGTNTPAWDWYITKNTNLLLAGSIISVPSPLFTVNVATPYDNPATGVNNIKITWTAAAIADGGPFYLVLKYRENNSTTSPTCAAQNIRVWNITPINTFILAMDGAMLNGGTYQITPNAFTCAADVVGATVNTTGPAATLVYGHNTLYYIATAKGILGTWKPAISVPALQTSQVYVTADWTSDMTGAGGWNTFGIATTAAAQQLVSSSNATVTDATNGTPILIRVEIDNVNWQTLADQAIVTGLDGWLPPTFVDPASDIWGPGTWPGNPDPCSQATPYAKTSTVTVKARPTITGNPATITLTNP